MNRKELALQLAADTVGNAGKWDVNKSWHAQYKDSAYVYVGGLPLELSEGDIVIVFSQFGEVVDVNLPRDHKTGKARGFAFIAYEDQRSTVLAVDNFNGAKLLGRTLRCDHCASFHQEQEKDPNNMPEHLARKLSERELEQKRQDIERRNDELHEEMEAKAATFAAGRATQESEEHQIRQRVVQDKESQANEKRVRHIDAVLAKHKREANTAASEEARKQEQWEERRRAREQAATGITAAQAPQQRAQPTTEEDVDVAGKRVSGGSADSRWERMMNGGGKKKKKTKPTASQTAAEQPSASRGEHGGKRLGEDSASVEETNRMRASLGLAPLRT